MAIVPGLGTVFAGEHGRSARVEGRSYHFRIEETMGFNDLPGMRQRYWRTDHPDAEYADFLKVRWMSVADGDDGHAVCRDGRTVAAPGKTELILRLEESYIPAYMLLDVIRVFHVSGQVQIDNMFPTVRAILPTLFSTFHLIGKTLVLPAHFVLPRWPPALKEWMAQFNVLNIVSSLPLTALSRFMHSLCCLCLWLSLK